MTVDCKSVDAKSMNNLLDDNQNIVLCPGGIHEQIRTRHDQERL